MDNVDTIPSSAQEAEALVEAESPASLQKQDQDFEGRIRPLIELLITANGLDEQQAQTIVNFAIATYGIDDLQIFPILVIYGPSGPARQPSLMSCAILFTSHQ